MLATPGYTQAAQSFARRMQGYKVEDMAARVAIALEGLVGT
jgi:hypothetical protein